MRAIRIRLRSVAGRLVALVAALALLALAIAAPGQLERASLYGALARASGEQLDREVERSFVTFASVSAVKSGMALLEGSSIGVGFDLEVGDLIQPAYDSVDFVWRLLLYALVVLGFYRIVLDAQIPPLGFPVLAAGFVLWTLSGLLRGGGPRLARIGRRLVLAGLLVVYTLPASLLATHWLSERHLGGLRAHHAQRMREAADALQGYGREALDLRQKVSLLRPGDSVEAVREGALEIARGATAAVERSLTSFLLYVVILGIQLVLLPLASAWILFRLIHLAVAGLEPLMPATAAAPAGRAALPSGREEPDGETTARGDAR